MVAKRRTFQRKFFLSLTWAYDDMMGEKILEWKIEINQNINDDICSLFKMLLSSTGPITGKLLRKADIKDWSLLVTTRLDLIHELG
jgi:hypothetical protein